MATRCIQPTTYNSNWFFDVSSFDQLRKTTQKCTKKETKYNAKKRKKNNYIIITYLFIFFLNFCVPLFFFICVTLLPSYRTVMMNNCCFSSAVVVFVTPGLPWVAFCIRFSKAGKQLSWGREDYFEQKFKLNSGIITIKERLKSGVADWSLNLV